MEININCDLGESSKLHSTENDPLLLEIVNSANIACGYHAGDKATMEKTIEISKKNNVSIGAHPSFNDPENFGRKRITLPTNEIKKLIIDQINILSNVANDKGVKVTHVKPHGALYNLASKNSTIAHAIGLAVKKIDPQLTIVGLSNSIMIDTWIDMGLIVAEEAFADRTYETDGSLRDRKFNNALITNPAQAAKQVMMIIKKGEIISVDGNTISINAQTICIHSDTKNALAIAKAVKDTEK